VAEAEAAARSKEVARLSGELRAVLAQVDTERRLAAELRAREATLSEQVEAFGGQFAALEAQLGRLANEKASFKAAADGIAAVHAQEQAAAARALEAAQTKLKAERHAREAERAGLKAAGARCREGASALRRNVAGAKDDIRVACQEMSQELAAAVAAVAAQSQREKLASWPAERLSQRLTAELAVSSERCAELEQKHAAMVAEAAELRRRAELTEELERSQSELAILVHAALPALHCVLLSCIFCGALGLTCAGGGAAHGGPQRPARA